MVRASFVAVVASLLVSTAARAEWVEASSQHFVVYSNDDPAKVKAFTTKLEKYDKAIKVLRNVPELDRGPAGRVTVFVVDDVSSIQKLLPGQNAAGFYSARVSGSVAFVPRRTGNGETWQLSAQRVLLHEYAHHFMYADWPTGVFPMWYSEGFAEFHSTALFNPDGSVTFGAPPTDRAYGVTLVNEMPLDRMVKPYPGKMSDVETFALYSRGWLLTHYLTMDRARNAQLASYVGAINEGKPASDAAKVFGSLKALDFKLDSYAKSPRFLSLLVPADKLTVGEVKVRTLGPGEAATMTARIRSAAGVTPAVAKQVVALARSEAAPFPNDPAAQNELAEAEFDSGNYAEAGAAADRALAADPKSVHAMVYKGMAMQAIAEKAKSTDAEQWKAARHWYIAANRTATEDPEPLVRYYQSFVAARQPVPKSAEEGLLYAYALAPFDLGTRMDAARIYLKRGDAQNARKAILPVAYSPHGGDQSQSTRDVVDTLDKDGPAAALALLDKKIADAAKKDKKDG